MLSYLCLNIESTKTLQTKQKGDINMNVWIVTTIMGFFGMFYILWIIKKELPNRDKRMKQKYIKEAEGLVKKENSKIQKAINKEKIKQEVDADKKRIHDNNEKYINLYNTIKKNNTSLNKKQMFKNNLKNGKKYEAW